LLFVKNTSPVAAPKIIQAEYYIDTDPGYGNAAQLTFTHAINVSDSVNLVPSSLSYGVHLFGIRAKDSTGHWSLDNKWLFVKSPSPVAAPKIVKVEYYIGTDPGYGKADSVKGFTPIVNLVDSAKVDVAGLANDSTYLIGIRAQDANGAWSLDNKLSVTVNGTFPILLTSLTGQYVNDADVLTAVIQVAVNVKVVQLEKSTDGTNFTYLGNMATAPVTPGTYKYNDENPSAGNSYYRLRIVNNDGSFSYSYIVLLNHTVAFTIEAYPNPVQNNLTVHFQNANAGTYNLMLTDIQGRNVFVQKVSTTQGQTGDMNISLSGYAAGTYFMQVTDASGKVVTTQKIIKEQ
jgi:hypothetical protein